MAIPVICWILFAVLWFRGTEFRISFVLFIVSAPIFFLDLWDGMENIPKAWQEMTRSLRPTRSRFGDSVRTKAASVAGGRLMTARPAADGIEKAGRRVINQSPTLLAKGLTKIYRGVRSRNQVTAIRELDLEIKAGERVAIIGSTGCGKSTFFRIACGLERPTAGRVEVEGRCPGLLSRRTFGAKKLAPPLELKIQEKRGSEDPVSIIGTGA